MLLVLQPRPARRIVLIDIVDYRYSLLRLVTRSGPAVAHSHARPTMVPYAPRATCAKPGCPELAVRDRRCRQHTRTYRPTSPTPG